MPIYEYSCSSCRTVFQFWSQRIGEQKTPKCPNCGSLNMKRLVSAFAIGKKSAAPPETASPETEDKTPDPFANMSPSQQEHVEREMMRLMSQAEDLDENNPRQMGSFLRKMKEATGLDMGPQMDEAIRRLEGGEDPEAIEEELGPLMGDESAGVPSAGGDWSYDDNLYDL